MHEYGMLRFMATMEVATGSFFTQLPTDHQFFPIRGFVASLQNVDLDEEGFRSHQAGSYEQCDECGKALWYSFGSQDRLGYEYFNNGCFYCGPCDRRLCEEEFGMDDYEYDNYVPYDVPGHRSASTGRFIEF